MGDMRDVFDDLRSVNREIKEGARAKNEEALRSSGLPWVIKNGGAHWMLRGGPDVDVYPGTGRWRVGRMKGRGMDRLLRALGVVQRMAEIAKETDECH